MTTRGFPATQDYLINIINASNFINENTKKLRNKKLRKDLKDYYSDYKMYDTYDCEDIPEDDDYLIVNTKEYRVYEYGWDPPNLNHNYDEITCVKFDKNLECSFYVITKHYYCFICDSDYCECKDMDKFNYKTKFLYKTSVLSVLKKNPNFLGYIIKNFSRETILKSILNEKPYASQLLSTFLGIIDSKSLLSNIPLKLFINNVVVKTKGYDRDYLVPYDAWKWNDNVSNVSNNKYRSDRCN